MSVDIFDQAEKIWRTLESDPEVLTDFIHLLGAPSSYEVNEIFGTSPDLLEFVPRPVKGVIFLSPLTPNCITYREEELSSSKPLSSEDGAKVFFMKQLVGNACGTVALTHILLNVPDVVNRLTPNSFFSRYYSSFSHQKSSSDMPIEYERGHYFAKDEELETLHDKAAMATFRPSTSRSSETANDQASKNEDQHKDDDMYDTILHYVAFVLSPDNKHVLELDGGRSRPIVHENEDPEDSTGTTLLLKAIEIAKQVMNLDPDENQFTLLAITKNE